MIAKNDKQIADFFAVPAPTISLIAINACIAPKPEERPVTETVEVAFGGSDALRADYWRIRG